MADSMNPRKLRPAELLRLVNSTQPGTLTELQLRRHRNFESRTRFARHISYDYRGTPSELLELPANYTHPSATSRFGQEHI